MNIPGHKAREDLSRMLSGAANVASAVRNQARSDIQARVEGIINRMDLVKRSEIEELESMLQKARTRQEELEARVAQLEAASASGTPAKSGTRSGQSGNAKGTKSGGKTGGTQSKKTSQKAGKETTNKRSS